MAISTLQTFSFVPKNLKKAQLALPLGFIIIFCSNAYAMNSFDSNRDHEGISSMDRYRKDKLFELVFAWDFVKAGRKLEEMLKNGAQIVDQRVNYYCFQPKVICDYGGLKRPTTLESEMLVYAIARQDRERTVEICFKSGAYPFSQVVHEDMGELISNNMLRVLVKYVPIAFKRAACVHKWLAPQLQCEEKAEEEKLEELIRSFEISPRSEGKEFYWAVVKSLALLDSKELRSTLAKERGVEPAEVPEGVLELIKKDF